MRERVITGTTSAPEEKNHGSIDDKILTHRIWGIPVFLSVILLVFFITFDIGKYPVGWIEALFSFLERLSLKYIDEGMFRDMLIHGVLAGVGGVAVYLPNILLLFFFISILEDSGYASRISVLMSGIMKRAGLQGNSFIPMLMGFGCNVPAIMAAREIPDRRNRILTVIVIPFMSCNARLPVYILFISAFFGSFRWLILMAIYLSGIATAWLTALLFSKTVLRQQSVRTIRPLPPLRMPPVGRSIHKMWFQTRYFIRKMGGVILVASLVIWALGYFPTGTHTGSAGLKHEAHYPNNKINATMTPYGSQFSNSEYTTSPDDRIGFMNDEDAIRLEQSYIGRIGRWIHPVFRPLGFDWEMSVAVLTGLPAKEIVVSTLSVLDGTGRKGLAGSSLIALSFMAFVLLSFPCIGTLTAIRKATGSRLWMLVSFLYTTGVAWLVSFIIFRAGSLVFLN